MFHEVEANGRTLQIPAMLPILTDTPGTTAVVPGVSVKIGSIAGICNVLPFASTSWNMPLAI